VFFAIWETVSMAIKKGVRAIKSRLMAEGIGLPRLLDSLGARVYWV